MKEIKDQLFYKYFERWIKIYKEGAIRRVTMEKYRLSLIWLKRIAPNLMISSLNRTEYQFILNEYAIYHEWQTTMDFHHQLKGTILDVIDEGYITKDSTTKIVIKWKTPRPKKLSF